MFDLWHAEHSVLREKVIEHIFLAELSRSLLLDLAMPFSDAGFGKVEYGHATFSFEHRAEHRTAAILSSRRLTLDDWNVVVLGTREPPDDHD